MQQIADNVYTVKGRRFFTVPIFIIENKDDYLTLIDAGLARDSKVVMKKIEAKWETLAKIERIVITHFHYDHVGGLEKILSGIMEAKQSTSFEDTVELVMHEADIEDFEKDNKNKAIKPTRLIKHQEYIDEDLKLKAIHVPGHTFGHICLLLEKQKFLFLGDVIMNINGKLRPVFKRAHSDFDLYKRTIAEILNYEWDFAFPSHFKAVKLPRIKVEKFITKIQTKD